MDSEGYIYKDLSLIFGLLSLFFAFLIPPTGILLALTGIYYEKEDMKVNHKKEFERVNLIVISLGVVLSITIFIKWLIHLFF